MRARVLSYVVVVVIVIIIITITVVVPVRRRRYLTSGAALLPEPADVRVVSHPPLLIVEPKLSEHVADFID
jgi:hypothetical protein